MALPPNLFAVVDVERRKVLARGMQRRAARGYAAGWKRLGGKPRIVADEAVFPTAEALLKLADV